MEKATSPQRAHVQTLDPTEKIPKGANFGFKVVADNPPPKPADIFLTDLPLYGQSSVALLPPRYLRLDGKSDFRRLARDGRVYGPLNPLTDGAVSDRPEAKCTSVPEDERPPQQAGWARGNRFATPPFPAQISPCAPPACVRAFSGIRIMLRHVDGGVIRKGRSELLTEP